MKSFELPFFCRRFFKDMPQVALDKKSNFELLERESGLKRFLPKSVIDSMKVSVMGDLRLSGSLIRKSRFIFTKERRTIRQKSGSLNHSNERIFLVNMDQGFLERGFIYIKNVGFALWILSHLS